MAEATRKRTWQPRLTEVPVELQTGGGVHYRTADLVGLAEEVRRDRTCPYGHSHTSGVVVAIDDKSLYLNADGAWLLVSLTCREATCQFHETVAVKLPSD